jgi:translation elongation factor EF-1beta
VGGASAAAAPSAAPAAKAAPKPCAGSDDSDSELDLFGDATPEEQAARDAHAKVVADAKARTAEKTLLSKSMIILDVKPWDDETDMAKLEAHVRSVEKDGLLWGSSKLVPVGFGIKKLQITAIILDAKVPSFDAIIEDDLVQDGENEYIQSADIASFNKRACARRACGLWRGAAAALTRRLACATQSRAALLLRARAGGVSRAAVPSGRLRSRAARAIRKRKTKTHTRTSVTRAASRS